VKVSLAFDLFANGIGDYFTLDDAVKGVLDNTTYLLAGDVLVDVSSTVRSVSVKRGRSKELQKFTAGVANVLFDNRNRYYDPLYTSSPYYGSIVPRKQVTIERDGYLLYTGQVADWNLDYDVGGNNTASISCTDGLDVLAQQTMPAGTQTAQATGARITAVLDSVSWPSTTRSISTGDATLGADVVAADTNALTYIQTVGDISEPGAVFVDVVGALTFRDRTDMQASTGTIFGTGGIPFTDIKVEYGIEEMSNTISVTYTGGTATATNDTSVAAYGAMDLKVDTLLSSATQADKLATWLVTKYGEPQYRITSLTVALHGITSAQVGEVLALDLGDTVQVTWTPGGVGSAISQFVTIEAIEHTARPGVEHHVTFTLSQTFASFIVGSSTFGVIGVNVLGW
jgi:hypothetical protein